MVYSRNGISPHENGSSFGMPVSEFKVSNLPARAKQQEVRNFLSEYGKIYSFELFPDQRSRNNSVAYIKFISYNRDLETIKLIYKGNLLTVQPWNQFGSITDQEIEFPLFKVQKLQIGNFVDDDTFSPEWECHQESVKGSNFPDCRFNFDETKIYIHFSYEQEFKAVINFKDIKDKLIIEGNEKDHIFITFKLLRPPKIFQLKPNIEVLRSGKLADPWFRATYITSNKLQDEVNLGRHPIMSLKPPIGLNVGLWLVWRLKFKTKELFPRNKLKRVLRECREFNLLDTLSPLPLLKTIDPFLVGAPASLSPIKFQSAYCIESIISLGLCNSRNINHEFIEFAKNLSVNKISHIIEKIWAGDKLIFNPIEYFKAELAKPSVLKQRVVIPIYNAWVRKVLITPTRIIALPPVLELTNRVIRSFSDFKDRFLRAVFVDEDLDRIYSDPDRSHLILARFLFILKYGLIIAGRKYDFLAFSSSQLREHGCWFFSDCEDVKAANIRSWLGNFEDIRNVAKYSARLGQSFSSSKDGAKLDIKNYKEIPDIIRNEFNFTDGIGQISPKLMRLITLELNLPSCPSAIQFRMGGYKGMLAQHPYLDGEEIRLRPSQRKFESDHSTLEVLRPSAFSSSHLNRQIITLLSALGVPDSIFIQLQNEMVYKLGKMKSETGAAIEVLINHSDEYGFSITLVKLLRAGFLDSQDGFLKNMLNLLYVFILDNLKNKARISVPHGALLIGVFDELGVLKENEVYVQISNPEKPHLTSAIRGRCIVTRNPCFHPGDIKVLNAVDRPELSHLINVIVFPSMGDRDIPSQLSGGDLDGDEFTVIWDTRLLPPKPNYAPMQHHPKQPTLTDKFTIEDVKLFFINYIINDNLGIIANAHLALSDQSPEGALDQRCLELAQLHSTAVDYPKTGRPADLKHYLRARKVPDFMEKPNKPSYESKKVLGTLYRSIRPESFVHSTEKLCDEILRVDGYDKYLESAIRTKMDYDFSIRSIMQQFGIGTEFEAISGYILNYTDRHKKRYFQIRQQVLNSMESIRKDFRTKFNAEFLVDEQITLSHENLPEAYKKASAWYYVSNNSDFNQDTGSTFSTFCWIVYDILIEIKNMRGFSIFNKNIEDEFLASKRIDQVSRSFSNSSGTNLVSASNPSTLLSNNMLHTSLSQDMNIFDVSYSSDTESE